jgi:hypothetical protein
MHSKLLIRPIRRPRLKLFSEDFKNQRFLLLILQGNLKPEHRMLFRNRYNSPVRHDNTDLPGNFFTTYP